MIMWIKLSGSDYSQRMASDFITSCFIAGKIWQKSQASVTGTENREIDNFILCLPMFAVR